MKYLENRNKPIKNLSLEEIEETLRSDEHYLATPTRNYGERDPVRDAPALTFPCSCGHPQPRPVFDFPDAEQLRRQGGGPPGPPRRRHFVRCEACGKRGRSTAQAWAAVIEWNREHVSPDLPVSAFPFFQLAGKSLDEAREKIGAIRRDLELRRAEARRRSAEGIETGRAYRARIDAYLGWAICASSLIKVHCHVRQLEQEAAQRAEEEGGAAAPDRTA